MLNLRSCTTYLFPLKCVRCLALRTRSIVGGANEADVSKWLLTDWAETRSLTEVGYSRDRVENGQECLRINIVQ